MALFFQFLVIGLATGSLYVLLSIGVVVIYRGSGVVNFAQGAIAMFGTFVFWRFYHGEGMPYAVAVVLALIITAGLGLLIHYLVMRPLANASPISRIMASLAILVLLEQIANLTFGPGVVIVPSALPPEPVRILGATVSQSQIYILGIVVIAVGALSWVYRRTLFGVATSAGAENRRALGLLGYSTDAIAGANWAIGCALAAGAGILLAPLTGLQVDSYTLLVLPALAAAIFGNLTSFSLTLMGGLLIGVVEAEVTHYTTTPGLASVAPFALVIVVMLFRGRSLPARGFGAIRLPNVGSGRIRLPVVILIAGGTAVASIWWLSPVWLGALTLTLGYAIILLSLVVVTGYSGQLSLAQFGFAGFGAWVAGRLFAGELHFPFILAAVLGVLATLPLGVAVGVICLRTRGVNLAVATLGLAVALEQLIFDNANLTGGFSGIVVNHLEVFGINISASTSPGAYAVTVLAMLVLASLVVALLRRSTTGRRMIAVRVNERAAASLGVSVVGTKLAAFGIGSMLAALGGIMVAFQQVNIEYTNFSAYQSIQLLPGAVVGGIGWIAGAAIGGVMQLGGLGSQVLDLLGNSAATYLGAITGGLLIVTLIWAPDGLAYLNLDLAKQVGRRFRKRLPKVPVQKLAPSVGSLADEAPNLESDLSSLKVRGLPDAPLVIDNIVVDYGGVRAVDHVKLTVNPGEVVGLIGPNGAGKTSLIDAVTGYTKISSGSIEIDGKDVSRLSPAKRCRLGIARTFQGLELFDDMTVEDNFRIASEDRVRLKLVKGLGGKKYTKLSPIGGAVIAQLDLSSHLQDVPATLPYGRRRLVSMGRALVTGPRILLLDEPASGMDEKETQELGSLIQGLAKRWNIGVLLVEHDVALVMSICDRIHAIDFGKTIAEGRPSDVRRDPRLVAAYLGDLAPDPALEQSH